MLVVLLVLFATCYGAAEMPRACWANLYCDNPYTTPRVNAACFGATSVSVLGDLTLCFHLYITPRVNAAYFGETSVSVLGNITLCFHPYTTGACGAQIPRVLAFARIASN